MAWFLSDDPEEKRKHYESLLPAIREKAKSLGYAIGVHGSMRRDFDLIAAPWVENCVSPDDLAKAIHLEVCGIQGWSKKTEKPHGRIGYVLHIGRHAYIDLSVMPTEK